MVIGINNCSDKYYYGIYNLFKNIFPSYIIKRDEKECDLEFFYKISEDSVEIFLGGENASEKIIYNNPLLSIKRCIYKLTGADLDFGVLTGVRPVKTALKFDKNIEKRLNEDYFISLDKAGIINKCAEYSKRVEKNLDNNTVSVYINIPFCPSRCNYCSFTMGSVKDYKLILNDYFKTLITDFSETVSILNELGFFVKYVYIGGGTPTVLSEKMLFELTHKIKSSFQYLEEFTVEAGRVDTITLSKLQILYDNGVSRISINPQSLNQKTLDAIGRKTLTKDFYTSFDNAKKLGFKVINTDLIAGLPNEKFSDFKFSFDEIIKLSPENITVHTLSKKRNSDYNINFSDNIYKEVKKMLDYTYETVYNIYEPYYIYKQKNAICSLENTGFCKNDSFSAYNIIMMEEIGNVVSVGAGGVSKFFENKLRCDKQPQTYISDISNIINRKWVFLYEVYERFIGI